MKNNVSRIAEFFPFQVASLSAESAKEFVGLTDEPRDLGPAPSDPDRYKPGTRIYGWRRGAK
jgi:hypothetical protein